jgi:dolichol-phosphate mannosyltransferase
MDEKQKTRALLIALPVFNEAAALENVLRNCVDLAPALRSLNIQLSILVVDDGSQDQSISIAKKVMHEKREAVSIFLFEHPQNMGLHAAIRSAFSWFYERSSEFDFLGMMDADNTHDPQQFLEMLKRSDDLVIASRYQKGASLQGVPWGRKVLSQTFSAFASKILKLSFTDLSSGLRLYSRSCVQSLWPLENLKPSFSCTVDLALRIHSRQMKVSEIPIRLNYAAKVGASKIVVREALRDALLLIQEYRREN